MRTLLTAALILAAAPAFADSHAKDEHAAKPKAGPQSGTRLKAEVWVDNWFEMYVNGEKAMQDSVPITTERSFNSETAIIETQFPVTIAIKAKDFKENDSGLEYIGTDRQQMGDGGMIAQFRDAKTGDVIGVTNSDMHCLVVHHAPVKTSCEDESDPQAGEGACAFEETTVDGDWTAPDFDDSDWPAAIEHAASDVSPKDGYDDIDWDDNAKFVWGESLKQDNTLLCRMTIEG
ncbi:PEBP family protein [Cobetia sp. L2A1]|uniref:PEBP family protein n=1 Tax=Cobetia sp. L2A1 TaxID=2686360 RepID=UPI00131E407E|nr:PEBP family protein [Cobetia sp. L2A1]